MLNNNNEVNLQSCLKKVKSRFQLCLIATYRARQLSQGHSVKISKQQIGKKSKNTSIALIEIAEGEVGLELLKKVPEAK